MERREGGVFVHSEPWEVGGHSVERLTMSPHYCLLEHSPEGEEERKNKLWGAEKYNESEESFLRAVQTDVSPDI